MTSDRELSLHDTSSRKAGHAGGSLRMDEQTMKLGLLMEAAHAQQALAETAVEMLREHIRGLDARVREEIRRTLLDELEVLSGESRRSAEALRALRRAADVRLAWWSVGSTVLCCSAAFGLAWSVLPSPSEVAALRATRDELAGQVARFEQQGGRIDLRRCGAANHLCVRVDRNAPAYGEEADYFLVKEH